MWQATATSPVLDLNAVTTRSNGVLAPIEYWPQYGPRHAPTQKLSCAQADRAADEQISLLLDETRTPCPKCGETKEG